MRIYMVNDLTADQMATLRAHLDRKDMASSMADLYWLDVPQDLLNDEQRAHLPECGPYSMGLELLDDCVQLELLVRARNKIRCSCVAYADAVQRAFAMDALDSLFHDLDIPV